MKATTSAIAIMAVGIFLPSCKKTPSIPAEAPVKSGSAVDPDRPAGFEKLTPKGQAAWLEMRKSLPAREAKAVRDRVELVRPAPQAFKPDNVDRKIRLRLIPQKEMMRAGDRFWYRLELQNVGRQPIQWFEKTSFFKRGELGFGQEPLKFFVRQPDGKEWALSPPRTLPMMGRHKKGYEFPPGTSADEQERRFKRILEIADNNKLSITLFPGETLVSRAWAMRDSAAATEFWARGEDPDAAIPGQFRELPTSLMFDQKGTYRIRVVYDDRPSPLSEKHIRSSNKFGISRKDALENQKFAQDHALGPVESNTVILEVMP